MTRFRRCPVVITAAIVGVSAVAFTLYYFWRQRKDEKKIPECCAQPSESSSSASSDVPKSSDSEPRVGAGQDDCTDMFKFSDENVRRVCERLFLEQMDLGEAYMEDAATVERGAMHLANAIVLTGETEPLLKVLRKGMSAENFACIQKYIPTAEMVSSGKDPHLIFYSSVSISCSRTSSPSTRSPRTSDKSKVHQSRKQRSQRNCIFNLLFPTLLKSLCLLFCLFFLVKVMNKLSFLILKLLIRSVVQQVSFLNKRRGWDWEEWQDLPTKTHSATIRVRNDSTALCVDTWHKN